MGIALFVVSVVFLLLTVFAEPIVELFSKHSNADASEKHKTEVPKTSIAEKPASIEELSEETQKVERIPSVEKSESNEDANDIFPVKGRTMEPSDSVQSLADSIVTLNSSMSKSLKKSPTRAHHQALVRGYPRTRKRQMAIRRNKGVYIHTNKDNRTRIIKKIEKD